MLPTSGTVTAVFHWFTGPLRVAIEVADKGHFFSVNPAMAQGDAGRKLLGRLPKDRILTETDGPYVHVSGRPARPRDVKIVVEVLAQTWQVSYESAEEQVESNTRLVLSRL